MKTYGAVAIALATLFSASAFGKVWCDFGAKGGYYAESCPANAKAQAVAAPPEKPTAWEPRVGMTAAEVSSVVDSKECWERNFKWCGMHKVNRTQTARGVHEQWVWTNARDMPIWFMYFDNGVLTAIQE